MKFTDALRLSWDRKAVHPTKAGGLFEGSDYGLRAANAAKLPFWLEPSGRPWTDVPVDVRRSLLDSDLWEPVNPKPAMLVLAEYYAFDWGEEEQSADEQVRGHAGEDGEEPAGSDPAEWCEDNLSDV